MLVDVCYADRGVLWVYFPSSQRQVCVIIKNVIRAASGQLAVALGSVPACVEYFPSPIMLLTEAIFEK